MASATPEEHQQALHLPKMASLTVAMNRGIWHVDPSNGPLAEAHHLVRLPKNKRVATSHANSAIPQLKGHINVSEYAAESTPSLAPNASGNEPASASSTSNREPKPASNPSRAKPHAESHNHASCKLSSLEIKVIDPHLNHTSSGKATREMIAFVRVALKHLTHELAILQSDIGTFRNLFVSQDAKRAQHPMKDYARKIDGRTDQRAAPRHQRAIMRHQKDSNENPSGIKGLHSKLLRTQDTCADSKSEFESMWNRTKPAAKESKMATIGHNQALGLSNHVSNNVRVYAPEHGMPPEKLQAKLAAAHDAMGPGILLRALLRNPSIVRMSSRLLEPELVQCKRVSTGFWPNKAASDSSHLTVKGHRHRNHRLATPGQRPRDSCRTRNFAASKGPEHNRADSRGRPQEGTRRRPEPLASMCEFLVHPNLTKGPWLQCD